MSDAAVALALALALVQQPAPPPTPPPPPGRCSLCSVHCTCGCQQGDPCRCASVPAGEVQRAAQIPSSRDAVRLLSGAAFAPAAPLGFSGWPTPRAMPRTGGAACGPGG